MRNTITDQSVTIAHRKRPGHCRGWPWWWVAGPKRNCACGRRRAARGECARYGRFLSDALIL